MGEIMKKSTTSQLTKNIKLFFVIFLFSVSSFLLSCADKTPYTSLGDGTAALSVSYDHVRMKSLVFEAANSGGELSIDVAAFINSKSIGVTFVTGTDNSKLVPTIRFCSDASCSETKTADELKLHYKPRYRSTDDAFYSCPAPIPGQEYDETTGWFETAIAKGYCVKENRTTLFKEPVTYVITAPDRSSIEYTMQTQYVTGTTSELVEVQFLQEYNTGLADDVKKTVTSSPVNITMPFGTNLSSLIPSLSINGSKVTSGADETGSTIISSSTAIDFSSDVNIFVHNVSGSDGSGSDEGSAYTLSLSVKDPFTEFSIEKSKNSGLSQDYSATIDHNAKTISFALNSGEDVSSLIPTIKLSDDSITISPSLSSTLNLLNLSKITLTSATGTKAEYSVLVGPSVSTFSPADGSSLPTVTKEVSITFDRAVDTSTISSSTVWVEAASSCSSSGNAVETVTPANSGDSKTFTLTFTSDWTNGTSYSTCVDSSVKDTSGYTMSSTAKATWTANVIPAGSLSDLILTEWGDAGTGVDYAEVKNFGSGTVTITNSNFMLNFDSTDVTLTDYLNNGVTDVTQKISTTGGVTILPGEFFLIVESDVDNTNITTIRGYDSFSGKIFLSTESTLVGSADRLDDQQVCLKDNSASTWSCTPSPFTAGTSTYSCLINSFSLGDDTTDNTNWSNGTSTTRRSAGVANSNCN